MQLDASGNILLAGYTQSSDFPVTGNAYQGTFGGGSDAFLAKISNDGSQLIYSTYLGGGGNEAINRMRVIADGSIYAVGDASADGLTPSATAVQKHTLFHRGWIYGEVYVRSEWQSADSCADIYGRLKHERRDGADVRSGLRRGGECVCDRGHAVCGLSDYCECV